MIDTSEGDQPTRIKVIGNAGPIIRMNTGDFFDLGYQATIHVTKATSENPIPPSDEKLISLRHMPEGIS